MTHRLENKIKPIHPFPARMAHSIVWDYLSTTNGKMKVLDPMSGSGTTVTIARYLGHEAYGIDTDPLAVQIASAWCNNLNAEIVRLKAFQVLEKAKTTFKTLKARNSYPSNSDLETREFIDYWFDEKNKKQLTALSKHIALIRDYNIRIFLWTAFSKMIITKQSGVSLAMDVSHSRPHKVYEVAPKNAFGAFLINVENIISKAPFADKQLFDRPKSKIVSGDSRQLPFPANSFDFIITSPPYLNAIDYFRASKLALVWMGNNISDIRKLRSENIGTEVILKEVTEKHIRKASQQMGNLDNLPSRHRGFAYRYLMDMDKVVSEINRVLKTGGKTIMVVGNSTLKNVYINNSQAIVQLASYHGLSFTKLVERELPPNRRYLPSPSNFTAGKEFNSRMRSEVVLEFKKL